MVRRLQSGLSMIEILVTLTIVAFGVLGLLGLQARALSFQKDSFDRKAAAELASDFAERLRGNYEAFRLNQYTVDLAVGAATPAIVACAPPCSSPQLAARDLSEWHVELRRRIPASGAYVRFDPANPTWLALTIAWPEPLQSAVVADAECAAVDGAIPVNYRCYRVEIWP